MDDFGLVDLSWNICLWVDDMVEYEFCRMCGQYQKVDKECVSASKKDYIVTLESTCWLCGFAVVKVLRVCKGFDKA